MLGFNFILHGLNFIFLFFFSETQNDRTEPRIYVLEKGGSLY